MQILRMHAPEGSQVRPKGGSRPFAGVAMDLTSAIPILVPRPCAHGVADGRMGQMAATVALPLVGREPRAACRNMFGDEGVIGPRARPSRAR